MYLYFSLIKHTYCSLAEYLIQWPLIKRTSVFNSKLYSCNAHIPHIQNIILYCLHSYHTVYWLMRWWQETVNQAWFYYFACAFSSKGKVMVSWKDNQPHIYCTHSTNDRFIIKFILRIYLQLHIWVLHDLDSNGLISSKLLV